MLITTVAGIEQVPVGTKLEAIQGKILKVYEYKFDTNANGPWSLQNITLQDQTGTTTVVLKNRPELGPDWAGASVVFVAGSHKGKPTGVQTDEYKEKRRVMVNEHAAIEEGEPQQQQRQAPQQRQQAPQTQQRPNFQEEERQEQENARPASQQRQQAPSQQREEPTAEDRLRDSKRDILRLVSLYTICHDAAVLHAASVYSRHSYTQHPAAIGALATTFFIEANRKQIGQNIPAVVPTQIPAPQFKMGDIVAEFERHQAELGLASPAVPADDSPPTPETLSAMQEKQW